MTKAAAITPIRKRVKVSIAESIKNQIRNKKYINKTTKYVIVK